VPLVTYCAVADNCQRSDCKGLILVAATAAAAAAAACRTHPRSQPVGTLLAPTSWHVVYLKPCNLEMAEFNLCILPAWMLGTLT
jgi:hypothetical protein